MHFVSQNPNQSGTSEGPWKPTYEAQRTPLTSLITCDEGNPHVEFDEGRDWDRKLTTTICLTPLSQSRLLYSAVSSWARSVSVIALIVRRSDDRNVLRTITALQEDGVNSPASGVAAFGPKVDLQRTGDLPI